VTLATSTLSSIDGYTRASRILVPFRGQNLIIECSNVHPQVLPRIEVVSSGDSPPYAFRLTNRPVLVESLRSVDGGRVRADRFIDVVRGTVRSDGPFMSPCTAGIVGAMGIGDVVFNEGVGGPSIN
jgi:hypothetical protein